MSEDQIDELDVDSIMLAAMREKDILLLEYTRDYQLALGYAPPLDLSEVIRALKDEIAQCKHLQWFDTRILAGRRTQRPSIVLAEKIRRTLRNMDRLRTQQGMICCFIIPALNEEEAIGDLLQSIQAQQTEYPVCVIVADNGSSDLTFERAQAYGANVVRVGLRGIGPARAGGLEHAFRMLAYPRERILIFQVDADERILRPDCVQKIISRFMEDPQLAISYGTTEYSMPGPTGSAGVLRTGRDFRKAFGYRDLESHFAENGRDIADFLLKPPYRILVGGNTVYRGNVFDLPGVAYPLDKSWESLVMSIRIQMIVPPDRIARIGEQVVWTSPRGYTDKAGCINLNRISAFIAQGFIPPYKIDDFIDPVETVSKTICSIEREIYDLDPSEAVKIVCNQESIDEYMSLYPSGRVLQAIHASSRKPIPGKAAIVIRNPCGVSQGTG